MSEKALRGLSEVLFYTALGLLLIQPLHAAWVASGFNNLYAWQALSWQEGNTTVPGAMGDVTHWRGQAYCSFPPLPSLVLLPFVWLFGIEVRVVAVAVGLLLLGLRALWLLLPRLGCPPARRTWLLGGFVAGTAYLYCVRESGAVWFFAHVCAMATLLCAITETLGKARGWLIGLLLGLTFLSRQMTIAGLPFFFLALGTAHPTASLRRQAWTGLIAGLIPCIAAYLAYNQFRFDSLFETGYTHIAHEDFLAPRFAQGGLFHLRYLPFNAAYLFLQGPHFDFWGKERLSPSGPDFFGTALPLASPFLLAAFLAKAQDPTDRQRLTGAWVAILCILLPTLCYYNNGYTQVNVQRFTLDFLPFLLLPVARGLTRLPETLWRGFVLWSLWLNVLYWVVLPHYYSLG